MSIYKAYDIRGIYEKDLTDEIMEKIGKALGTMIIRRDLEKNIIVGNDIRKSSPALSKAFIKGITSMGVNLSNVGTTSFGLTLFSGWKLKRSVIAYITASHNPPEWNGIKFYDKNGVGFFSKDNKELGRMVEEEDFEQTEQIGKVENVNMKEEYIQYLKSAFNFNRNLKVVLDCGNGSTSLVAPELFKSLENIEVKVIFSNVDPNFKDRGADIKKENLQKLGKKVVEEKADIGIAFDGDGDRVGIVNELGELVNPDQLSIIIAKKIFEKNKGKMISNIECSMIIEKNLSPLGIEIIRVPVGHSYVIQSVQHHKAMFGSEFSGHFVIPSYFPFDDAVIPALKIIEIVSQDNKNLSELSRDILTYPQKRFSVDCSDEIKFKIIESLKQKLSNEFDRVNTMDGVRVDFENGWILIRASNTTPMIRLTVEALDENELNRLKSQFLEILHQEIEKTKPS